MFIKSLTLNNFRLITEARLTTGGAPLVALVGDNGAGKTSVLEALALLSPGRGLHRSPLDSHIYHGEKSWGVFAELADGTTIGQEYNRKKRIVKANGEVLTSAAQLLDYGNVLWLTPKMDRLFIDAVSSRREFFDRLVFGRFPQHASNLSRYKHHLKARMKLLKDGAADDWLSIEEQAAAALAAEITTAREKYLAALAPHIEAVTLQLTALDMSDFTATLHANRDRDQRYGTTHAGPHRVDVTGVLTAEKIPFHQASTGQHKRAVLHILLANARLIAAQAGTPPLLLFDEFAAHLDRNARQIFFDDMAALGAQVWLTGTESGLFEGLSQICTIGVENGQFCSYDT